MDHEQAFISVFVIPEKRARYAQFLPKPKRRTEITGHFSHFFDFVPALAKQIPRCTAAELAPLLRARGVGDTAHVIGGRDEIDGQELPLEQAIDCALADPSGVVVSCVPGRLALYLQEFPPGDTFILSDQSRHSVKLLRETTAVLVSRTVGATCRRLLQSTKRFGM